MITDKKYWITKALESITISSNKISKEEIINILSKQNYNLSKDLNCNATFIKKLCQQLCPNRKDSSKIDIYLIKTLDKKLCRSCNQVYDLDFFHKNKSNKNGLNSNCVLCHNKQQQYYYKNHSEEQILRIRNREINLLGFLSQDDIEFIFIKYDYKCKQCGYSNLDHNIDWGENLHLDHIIPISKNGLNIVENIQLLCRKCNSSKGNKIGS